MKTLDFGVKDGNGLDFNMKSGGEPAAASSQTNSASADSGAAAGVSGEPAQPDKAAGAAAQSNGSENNASEVKENNAADKNNNGSASQTPPASGSETNNFDISKVINPKTNKPLLEDYETLATQFSAIQTELAALKSAPPANTQTEQNRKDQEILQLSTQLSQVMDFIKNPELIEFSKADDKTVEQWIRAEEFEKVKRYNDWKINFEINQKMNANKPQTPPAAPPASAPAVEPTKPDNQEALAKEAAENKRREEIRKNAVSEAIKEIKTAFNEDWTEKDIDAILSTQLTGKDIAIIKYIRTGNIDKILSAEQRESIMKSELERKRIEAEKQPPHSAAANNASSIPQSQEKKGKRNFMSIFGSNK
ncbi:MAG TPA: hypothetical protein PKY81_15330 [bacterium]|nr:hypothetical protein [bacterium]HPN32322.1 hypothetical protein [bacterium]